MKKKLYDPDVLKKAYAAVHDGMSVYRAARNYGVPESTLRDRTLGLVSVDNRSTKSYLFDESTEKQIVDHIKHMANIGYGFSRVDVLYLATDLAIYTGKRRADEPILSNKWYHGFLKRWPNLTVSKPQKLSMQRARCASKETLANYYKELGTIMTKHDLHDKPHKIYNIDESALQTEHSPNKIVHDIVVKPQSITSARSANVTIIGAGNAIGNAIPPYYIFPGVKFDKSILLEGAPPGSDGQCSKTGWSNSELFKTYLEKHFLKYISHDKNGPPLLILFDGHRSHVSLTLQDWAQTNNIILFILPPHCSHILQPLDIGCFGPLKACYNREAQLFLRKNPGCKVTKYNISQLSCNAYQKGLSSHNLTNSFKKSGIFPFNPKAVDVNELAPSTIYTDTCVDNSGNDQQQIDISTTDTTPLDLDSQSILLPLLLPENQPPTELIYTAEPIIDIQPTNKTIPEFLNKRTIVSVPKPEKKRNHFTITGHLGKKKNIAHLSSQTAKKKPNFKPPFKKEQSELLCEKNKQKTGTKRKAPLSTNKKVAKQSKLQDDISSGLGTSGLNKDNGGPLCIESDSVPVEDSELTDDDDNDVCCLCNKRSPDEIHRLVQAGTLVFVKWAKCDNPTCDHWTHLKFCSNVNVVRRGDAFYCPRCT